MVNVKILKVTVIINFTNKPRIIRKNMRIKVIENINNKVYLVTD